MLVKEKMNYRTKWTCRKYASRADYEEGRIYEKKVTIGNILLNEGITEALNLMTGNGTPTVYSNANSYIGVGDSSDAAAATQIGLQASTNKAYAAMASTYPQVSNQTMTFRSVFTELVANFDWREMTVANGSSDTAKNLNRKVSSQGTKASGQIWTLDLAITLS